MNSTLFSDAVLPAPRDSLPLTWTAWVVTDSSYWGDWARRQLEARGAQCCLLRWEEWASRREAGQGSCRIVLTDGSRPAGGPGRDVIEAGANLGDPWDSFRLNLELDAAGLPRPLLAGSGDSRMPEEGALRQAIAWFLGAGERMLGELAENLRLFRNLQPKTIRGSDYLSDAVETVARLGSMRQNFARVVDDAPSQSRETCPVWPSLRAVLETRLGAGGWTWSESLPDELPPLGCGRWQLERVLDGIASALDRLPLAPRGLIAVTGGPAGDQLALDFSGIPAGNAKESGGLGAALLEVAARCSAVGGRFWADPADGWHCRLPLRARAAWLSREEAGRLPRVVVAGKAEIERSLLAQSLWRKGYHVIEKKSVAQTRVLARRFGRSGCLDAVFWLESHAGEEFDWSGLEGKVPVIRVLADGGHPVPPRDGVVGCLALPVGNAMLEQSLAEAGLPRPPDR